MAHLDQHKGIARREEALAKKDKVKHKPKDIFKVEENDILVLTGPYSGKRISELWLKGPDERDYIFQNLYKTNDVNIQRIISAYFCK